MNQATSQAGVLALAGFLPHAFGRTGLRAPLARRIQNLKLPPRPLHRQHKQNNKKGVSMSKPYVKIDSSKTGAVQPVSAMIHFNKEDSQSHSLFQTLGKAYLMLDALTAYKPDRPDIGKTYFLNALIQSGWDLEMAQEMLVHIDWGDRIYSDWYWIGNEERTSAVTLNYDVYQNFWPNLDFCAPGFEAEALDWVCLRSNGEPALDSSPEGITVH